MLPEITEFIASRWRIPAARVRLNLQPMRGGLESPVTRAELRRAPGAPGVPHRLVVKALHGNAQREVNVYEVLWRHLQDPPAARVFGSKLVGETHYLFLEDLASACDWPWRDTAVSLAVCRALAQFHESAALRSHSWSWDYEAELAQSAGETLALANAARRSDGTRVWLRLAELKRVVAALPEIRARVLASGTTVIHGDVHPGNVVIQQTGSNTRVTLIDWNRIRIGSPLEDVASWLHSLGCWEPEARRRHDTLLLGYLQSRSSRSGLTSDLRRRYWLASVSNGLAGAIRYHIAILSAPGSTSQAQTDSAQALRAWTRVVRQAASLISISRSPQTAAPVSRRTSVTPVAKVARTPTPLPTSLSEVARAGRIREDNALGHQ